MQISYISKTAYICVELIKILLHHLLRFYIIELIAVIILNFYYGASDNSVIFSYP